MIHTMNHSGTYSKRTHSADHNKLYSLTFYVLLLLLQFQDAVGNVRTRTTRFDNSTDTGLDNSMGAGHNTSTGAGLDNSTAAGLDNSTGAGLDNSNGRGA